MSRTVQVTFDCHDPNALAGSGTRRSAAATTPRPGLRDLGGGARPLAGPRGGPQQRLCLRRSRRRRAAAVVPEGAGGQVRQEPAPPRRPGRVGLQGDERMAALEAECAPLAALGAAGSTVSPSRISGGHIVMQDPEGNEFCLD